MRKLLPAIVVSLALAISLLGLWIYFDKTEIEKIRIAAGSKGSESFTIAQSIALMVQRSNPNLIVEVLETQGSNQNMQLLESQKVQMATIQADTKTLPAARLIAQLYPDAFQLVVRQESDIQSVADLRGKQIAIASKSSGQYNSFWFLANHYGMYEGDIEAMSMSTSAANWAFISNAVDAVFRVRGPGNPSILELIEKIPSRIITIDQASALKLKTPTLDVGVIPKGSYQGEPALPEVDLETVAVQRLLVANKNVSKELVYQVTEVLFEQRKELLTLAPLAGFIRPPDRSQGTFMPVHEGAQSYYDRDKPSFLQEQAEPIALMVTLSVLLISGLLQLQQRHQKSRIDQYTDQVMAIFEDMHSMHDSQLIAEAKAKLMRVLKEVTLDVRNGKVNAEGFNYFSVTWQAVNDAIGDEEMLNALDQASFEKGRS
ncbi:MAG TPA: TAXI family TRAP transporter solute-binding subunit [Gammaproteobacteria bacterium]|nr:TAXI family TRAP transporter solute-binding subunit [Gammaproteobacteria bacterium]